MSPEREQCRAACNQIDRRSQVGYLKGNAASDPRLRERTIYCEPGPPTVRPILWLGTGNVRTACKMMIGWTGQYKLLASGESGLVKEVKTILKNGRRDAVKRFPNVL